MPLVDKPLAELLTYAGRNPKPADFDSYWDAGIAEMHALGSGAELIPVHGYGPNVEAFDLWFLGVGGARIYAKYLRPKGAKNVPAVVEFHGYTHHSGDWPDKLKWIANGFAVAALDCRGQGGRSEDNSSVRGNTHNGHIIRGLDDAPGNLLYRSIFLDTAQLARIVMDFDEVDATRVGALGGSQGGGLTIACAALEPSIKRAAPSFPFLSDYLRVWEMDLASGAYNELKTYFRHFDPRHERQDAIFERLGYIDVQHLAPRVQATTLMPVGLMDTITPPSTCFAAYNKIKAPKEFIAYPDYGHESPPDAPNSVYQFMMGL